jgi:hypothetical protein
MNLANKINDLFQKYSVKLEVAEGEIPAEVVVEEPTVASKVLSNGTQIYVDAPEFTVGLSVYVLNEEGEKIPLPDGEYDLEGGGTISIAEGVLASITEAEAEAVEEAPAEAVVVEQRKRYKARREANKRKRGKRGKFSKSAVRRKRRAKDYKTQRAAKFAQRKLSRENTMLKAELENLKNTSASKPLARRAKSQKKEKVDLSTMTTEERIYNLHNLYR